jgi:hypothetical protein
VVRVVGSACGWDATDPVHAAAAATQAFLTFDNGVRGLWTSGSISPLCGEPAENWQHIRAGVHCERGRVEWQHFGTWEIISPGGIERGDFGGIESWLEKDIAAQRMFHEAMFHWLDGGKPVGTDLKRSLHEWAAVLALYQSALERRPIEMGVFNPAADLVDRYRRAVQ